MYKPNGNVFYHKKFLADFLRRPLALVSEFSLRLRPVRRLEAKEMIPPARVLPVSSVWGMVGGWDWAWFG